MGVKITSVMDILGISSTDFLEIIKDFEDLRAHCVYERLRC